MSDAHYVLLDKRLTQLEIVVSKISKKIIILNSVLATVLYLLK
jgi:hypothetical protein